MGLLTPTRTTPPDPDHAGPEKNLERAWQQVRGMHLLRTTIGWIGVLLPVALLVGDWLLGDITVRGSLSAYYHSGVRDLFVGVLCATAVFLVTYKVHERGLENTASTVAGVALLGVAFLPTERPPGLDADPTRVQLVLGEAFVGTVHGICATVFILLLAVISREFGVRSPGPWRALHLTCAAVIVLAVAGIALSLLTGVFAAHSVLVGESVAVFAFGTSWLVRGIGRGRIPGLTFRGLLVPAAGESPLRH